MRIKIFPGLIHATVLTILLTALITGCARQGYGLPTNPSLNPGNGGEVNPVDERIAGSNQGHRSLLGLYRVEINLERKTIEHIPLRTANLHANLVEDINYLDLAGISIDWDSCDLPNKILAIDLTFTHPYPNNPKLCGFDSRCILMTPGSVVIGSLVLADVDGWRLLNADGYSRWWNPVEFTGDDLFGYVPGNLGSPETELLTATVNPYKYYCDYLDKFQPVSDITGLALDHELGRGITYPGSTSTRRLMLKLPADPQAPTAFNYAVDVSWDQPDPDPPQNIPPDYPMTANQSEAYLIDAEIDINTLYYDPGSTGGGQLKMSCDIYDWQGQAAGNINDEITVVRVFAPDLFPGGKSMVFVSDDGLKARYEIDLSGDAIPTKAGECLVLIRVGAGTLKYSDVVPIAPDSIISAFHELVVEVKNPQCIEDQNNGFADAVELGWDDSVGDSLCRLDGVLTDYKDFYSFNVGSDVWEEGTINLYTGSDSTFLSIYNSSQNKIAQVEVIGGSAIIDTVGLCDPGLNYIRVLTQNESEIVLYQLHLIPHELPSPPEFIEGISGQKYPRNLHEATYGVWVDSDLPVMYNWEIEHPLGWCEIDLGEGNGNGTVDIIFDSVGIEEGEWLIKCGVYDGVNSPVYAEPYHVFVNGLIFSADMNDNDTGDNANWIFFDEGQKTTWTTGPVTDDTLEGTGRKFGEPNATCEYESAHNLVSPTIDIPAEMTKGIMVFRHSFDFGPIERGVDTTIWQAYNGGNVKLTLHPNLPYCQILPSDIRIGRWYWSMVTYETSGNLLQGQDIFSGINHKLTTSVVEIPPEFAGETIHIGFSAATSKCVGYEKCLGWLIDDVKVYILDDQPNATPDVGEITGGNLTPGWNQEVNLELPATDPDGDRVYYTWYLWDFRHPGNRIETVYYDDASSDSISFTVQQIIESNEGYLFDNSNRYWIPVMITDGFHYYQVRDEWCVGGGQIFHAKWDFGELLDFDHNYWSAEFEEGSDTTWHVGWHESPDLVGKGPLFTGGDYTCSPAGHGVLFTPQIFIPPGFSNLQLLFTHSYEFDDVGFTGYCQDGGNVHILDGENYLTDFSWNSTPIMFESFANTYDCVLMGNHQLIGKPGFCDDDEPNFLRASVHNLDPSWFGNPNGIRLGFAAATGTMSAMKAGWQLDEVVIMGH